MADLSKYRDRIDVTRNAPLLEAEQERDKFKRALEDIALLDESGGHDLTRDHALRAVAISTSTLRKHPSQIFAERAHQQRTDASK